MPFTDFLTQNQIKFYHAIQLNDFKTYCASQSVLSRRVLSERNPYFTRFFSDSKDFAGGHWARTFGNLNDFGSSFGRFGNTVPNAFGPICIVFSHNVWPTMTDLHFTTKSVTQQNYDPSQHDLSESQLKECFTPNDQGQLFVDSSYKGIELSSSTEHISLSNIAFILVDPIKINGKSLRDEVLNQIALNNLSHIITENRVKSRLLHDGDSYSATLADLLSWSSILKGTLLHRKRSLKNTAPEELLDWVDNLHDPGVAILASWLTYTYNGTILHMEN